MNKCQHCILLETEIEELKTQLDEARAKLGFLERHPTLASGARGESFVVELTGLHSTEWSANYDVGSPETHRLEVKYSALRPNKANGKVFRWTWAKILGQSGSKDYDRLILLAEKDSKCAHLYVDPKSAHVIFDIPFLEVPLVATSGGTAGLQIRLSSNPSSVRGKSSILFEQYQITECELTRRYKI